MSKRVLLAFGLVAAVVVVVLLASGGDDSSDGYRVRAVFDNGGFMVKGEEVRVAGANVGEIESVDVSMPGEPVAYENGEMVEKPGKAIIVMNITDPGYLSDFVPDIGVLNGPYLIKDPNDYARLLASDWYKGVEKKLEAAGFKLVMANGFFGQRHLISDKPVKTPADMAGMTVRVPPNTMWIETFKAMGARPTTVQWSEVYNALQQNVVAGAEAPLAVTCLGGVSDRGPGRALGPEPLHTGGCEGE